MVKYIKQLRKYGFLDSITPSIDLDKYGLFPNDVYHNYKATDRLIKDDLDGTNGFMRKWRRKLNI